jgi:hypothetical protein
VCHLQTLVSRLLPSEDAAILEKSSPTLLDSPLHEAQDDHHRYGASPSPPGRHSFCMHHQVVWSLPPATAPDRRLFFRSPPRPQDRKEGDKYLLLMKLLTKPMTRVSRRRRRSKHLERRLATLEDSVRSIEGKLDKIITHLGK